MTYFVLLQRCHCEVFFILSFFPSFSDSSYFHSSNVFSFQFFDEIRIEDPRVPELCNKTSELSPYSILLNCLQRNFGLNGANIESRLVTQKNQKNEFVMTVGKHTVQVQCKNKKDGKQRASQAILQACFTSLSYEKLSCFCWTVCLLSLILGKQRVGFLSKIV